MNRPSKELVDRALDDTGLSAADPDEFTTYDVLAAEVCALRDEQELLQLSRDNLVTTVSELRATIARVEALPAAYRAMPRGRGYAGCDPLGVADAIEAALKPCASGDEEKA